MGEVVRVAVIIEETGDIRDVELKDAFDKLNEGLKKKPDILVAPSLFLTPGRGNYLLSKDRIALEGMLMEITKNERVLVVPGSFLIYDKITDRLYESASVISEGELLGRCNLFYADGELDKAAVKFDKKRGYGKEPFIVHDNQGMFYGVEMGEDHLLKKYGVLANHFRKNPDLQKLDFHILLSMGQMPSNFVWTLKDGGYLVCCDGKFVTSQVVRNNQGRGEMIVPVEVSKGLEVYEIEIAK